MFLYSCMNFSVTSLGQIESIDAVCIKVCPHLHNLIISSSYHHNSWFCHNDTYLQISSYRHLNFRIFFDLLHVLMYFCIFAYFYHSAFSAVCILCLQVNFQICATARNLDTTPSSSARIRRKKYSQKSQLDIFDKISN